MQSFAVSRVVCLASRVKERWGQTYKGRARVARSNGKTIHRRFGAPDRRDEEVGKHVTGVSSAERTYFGRSCGVADKSLTVSVQL
jgi:hypothetical protein